MSLAEVLISLFLLTATLLMVVNYIGLSFGTTKANKEKDFATQKAIQIVNELRAYVQGGGETHADMLDNYDDGVIHQEVLTTQRGVIDPADPLSGNYQNPDGNWNFVRLVNVMPLPNENSRDVRKVMVKVFKTRDGQPHKTLADITTVIRTIGDFFPPTQVFDVYCIAVENVPGWWVHMSTIRPLVENAINDIQSRNPGLEFRVHWITRHGYGRDPLYAPFLNLTGGPSTIVDWTYHYPGLVRTSDNFLYYDPQKVGGRLNVDGVIQNAASYALADQYNHCVRYPRELEIRATRTAEDEEPSLRQLLEELNSNPDDYRNAIILNLHGELLPTPPVRNYSDAARDPGNDGSMTGDIYNDENRQGVRVVTHAEQLEYENNEAVTLRVYAYRSKEGAAASPVPNHYAAADNVHLMKDMIVIRLEGVTLDDTLWSTGGGPADYVVTPVFGGVREDSFLTVGGNCGGAADEYNYTAIDVAGAWTTGTDDVYREWATDWWGPPTGIYEPYMCYDVRTIADDPMTTEDETATVICLYYTPLECPQSSGDGSGLPPGQRLYGMDYIPCPVHSDFAQDLTDTSSNPKNTARWIITLPDHVLPDDGMLTIETRITDIDADPTDLDLLDGSGLEVNRTGDVSNHPYNLSETYVWIGNAGIPVTERYQLLGDPRHCPYLDVKLDHRYNWYWQDDGTMGGYSGFNECRLGWSGDRVEFDVPRAFNFLRSGIMNSGAIFTTMNGFSFYYVGLGNEVGADACNGFGSGIPVNSRPYTGGSGSTNMKAITGSTRGIEELSGSGDERWFCIPWLGETFPDAEFLSGSTYLTNGNLSSSSFRSREWRDLSHSSLDFTNSYDRRRRTNKYGCASFFNATGSGNGPFNHYYNDGSTATVQAAGEEMGDVFNYPLPEHPGASRPFKLDYGSNYPNEWNESIYSSVRNTSSYLEDFYWNTSSKKASSLIQLQSATNPDMNLTASDYGFFVMNGLDRGINSGEAFLGRYAVISLVHALMTAGHPDTAGRIHQVPRVEITSPTDVDALQDPSVIEMAWDTDWLRWDDQPYLDSYPDGFSESDDLTFAVKYSRDSGATWFYMQDNSSTTTGTRPESGYECPSDTHYDWNVSNQALFPEGSYVIRVEAYRDGNQPLHYAYHQRRIFIQRG